MKKRVGSGHKYSFEYEEFNKEVEKQLLAANIYDLQNKFNKLNKMINDANDKNVKYFGILKP